MFFSPFFHFAIAFAFLASPSVIIFGLAVLGVAITTGRELIPAYLERRKQANLQYVDPPNFPDPVINNDPSQVNTKPSSGVGNKRSSGTNTRQSNGNRRVVKPLPPGVVNGGSGSGGTGTTTTDNSGGGSNTKSSPKSSDDDITKSGGSLIINNTRPSLTYFIPVAISGVLPPFNNPLQIPNPFSYQSNNPNNTNPDIKAFPNEDEIEEFSENSPPDTNRPSDTPVLSTPIDGFFPLNPIPRQKHTWILASHSTFTKTKGRTIRPPVLNIEQDWVSSPVDEDGNFNPKDIDNILATFSNEEAYLDYLFNASQGTTDENNLDLADLSLIITPKYFEPNSSIEPIFGVQTLVQMAKIFQFYSDSALSPVQFNAPLKINFKEWKITNNFTETPEHPMIKDYFKPQDPNFQEKIKEANLLGDGQEFEIDPTQLLNWTGNISLKEGGELEQQKTYNSSDEFSQSNYLKNLSVDDIINGNIDETIPKPRTTPAKLKAKSRQDLNDMYLGIIHNKLGLDQFPSELPTLKDPDTYRVDNEGKIIPSTTPPQTVPIPNLATGLAYGHAKTQKTMGSFPLEIETDSVEEITDPDNPNATIKKKDHAYLPNMATAFSQIAAISMAGAAIGQFNMNTNLKNTRTLNETRSLAMKSANCSCAMMDFGGANANPAKRCLNNQFNFRNAKGFNDMSNPKAEQCDVGLENTDNTTIKKYLTDILFGVNLVKGAFFKGNKELDQQIESIRDLEKEIKEKDKKFDDFVEEFNKEKNPLTKEGSYPIKPKIIVENKPDPNQSTP